MTIEEQKNLYHLMNEYNKIDSVIIKSNLIKYIDRSEYKRNSQELADKLGLNLNTIYLYRQPLKRSSKLSWLWPCLTKNTFIRDMLTWNRHEETYCRDLGRGN